MREWISIKDRLPDTGTLGCSEDVLIALSVIDGDKIETIQAVGFYTFYEEYNADGSLKFNEAGRLCGKWGWAIDCSAVRGINGGADIYKDFAVTHWMPLPENPDGITEDLVYELDGYDYDEED